MCIILQNVKKSQNLHLCSNFQENNIFKAYACTRCVRKVHGQVRKTNLFLSDFKTFYIDEIGKASCNHIQNVTTIH